MQIIMITCLCLLLIIIFTCVSSLSSSFFLNVSIECWASTLSDRNLFEGSFSLDLFLGLVHAFGILGHELHGDLGSVEDLAADLPVDDTEVDVGMLKDVNRRIEELGVEEVPCEYYSRETHSTLKTRSLPLGFLHMLHILLLVFLFFFSDEAQARDVLVLRSEFAMAANHCIANLDWEVHLLVKWEIRVGIRHGLHKWH